MNYTTPKTPNPDDGAAEVNEPAVAYGVARAGTYEEIKRRMLDLPEVEYPPEVVARWNREAKEAREQIALGEFVPKTIEELAEEHGLGDYWRSINV